MKKFLLAVVLSFTAIFAQVATAQAADYYVGTSEITGMECYLMTHTIAELRHHSDGGRFAARLKMVGEKIRYLDYELDIGAEYFLFKNSAGYSGVVSPYHTPIEWNMCQYIAQNYLWH